MSVTLHLVSPLSKGLFQRAIMQSGASSTPMFSGKVTKARQLELFVKVINCSLGPDLVACVRDKAVNDIVTGQMVVSGGGYNGPLDMIGSTVDGEVLPDLPEILFKTGKFHPDVDVITGAGYHKRGCVVAIDTACRHLDSSNMGWTKKCSTLF